MQKDGKQPASSQGKQPDKRTSAALRTLLTESGNRINLARAIEQDKKIILPFIIEYCGLWDAAIKIAKRHRENEIPCELTEYDPFYEQYHDLTGRLNGILHLTHFGDIWSTSLSHPFGKPLEYLYQYSIGSIELGDLCDISLSANTRIAFNVGIDREPGTFKPEDFLGIIDHICFERKLTNSNSYFSGLKGHSVFSINTVGGIVYRVITELVQNARYSIAQKYGKNISRGSMLLIENLNGCGDLEISIHDNGIGINPEIIDRIFEPGVSTKGEMHGSGLAYIFRLMELIGGSVSVKSELGNGATFTLVIPREFVEKTE
ncbi:ATP-binding protein [Candidatus Micrarchaeota archaeon]|nr:ATP-binding protein [Candidatus Micrarchaeota archaeon]